MEVLINTYKDLTVNGDYKSLTDEIQEIAKRTTYYAKLQLDNEKNKMLVSIVNILMKIRNTDFKTITNKYSINIMTRS